MSKPLSPAIAAAAPAFIAGAGRGGAFGAPTISPPRRKADPTVPKRADVRRRVEAFKASPAAAAANALAAKEFPRFASQFVSRGPSAGEFTASVESAFGRQTSMLLPEQFDANIAAAMESPSFVRPLDAFVDDVTEAAGRLSVTTPTMDAASPSPAAGAGAAAAASPSPAAGVVTPTPPSGRLSAVAAVAAAAQSAAATPTPPPLSTRTAVVVTPVEFAVLFESPGAHDTSAALFFTSGK